MSRNFAKHGCWRCVWNRDDAECIPGYMSLLEGAQWSQRPRDIQDPEINAMWLAGLWTGPGREAGQSQGPDSSSHGMSFRAHVKWFGMLSKSRSAFRSVMIRFSLAGFLWLFLEDRREKLKIEDTWNSVGMGGSSEESWENPAVIWHVVFSLGKENHASDSIPQVPCPVMVLIPG